MKYDIAFIGAPFDTGMWRSAIVIHFLSIHRVQARRTVQERVLARLGLDKVRIKYSRTHNWLTSLQVLAASIFSMSI